MVVNLLAFLALLNWFQTIILSKTSSYGSYFFAFGIISTLGLLYAAMLKAKSISREDELMKVKFEVLALRVELEELNGDCERLLDTIEEGNYP